MSEKDEALEILRATVESHANKLLNDLDEQYEAPRIVATINGGGEIELSYDDETPTNLPPELLTRMLEWVQGYMVELTS